MTDPIASAVAANALCQSCGLCCAGLLFNYVRLKDNDGPARRHMPDAPEDAPMHSIRIAQPCGFLQDTSCGIYGDRPQSCRDFQCDLRRSVLNGEVAPGAAETVLAELRRELDGLQRKVGTYSGEDPLKIGVRRFGESFSRGMRRKLQRPAPASEAEKSILRSLFRIARITDRNLRVTSRLGTYADLMMEIGAHETAPPNEA